MKFDQGVTFLYTTDLSRATRFYEDVLGLERVLEQADCRLWRISDDSFIGFCEKAEPRAKDGVCVTLVTDNVDEVCRHLHEHGVPFEKEPEYNPQYDIYNAFVRDPDGYLVEIQRFESPDWPRKK
ncbi:MAG: VOC family protein [Planctomycetota bacterium]|nr:VOC family protein [Planctomycetota bacterium]